MRSPIVAEEPTLINEYSHWCRPTTVGVLTALTVGLLLDILGIGIESSLFSPTKGVLYSLSIGTVAWLLFVSVASMYAGAWIAGYFSRGTSSKTGIFYGIMVSTISIVILLALTLSALGTVVSSSLNGLQLAMSSLRSTLTEGPSAVNKLSKGLPKISPTLSEKVKRIVPDLQPVIEEVNQKAAEFLPSQNQSRDEGNEEAASEQSSNNVKTKLEKLIYHYLNSTGRSENEKARQELINFLAQTSGKSRTEINQQVEEWQKLYREAKEKTREAAMDLSKDIAKTVSQLALLNFFLLLSGITAAVAGGIHGIKWNRTANL